MSKENSSGRSKVDSLMSEPKRSAKSRRTLYLTDANYKKLEKIADEKGRSPSEIIDVLIDDFLNRYG